MTMFGIPAPVASLLMLFFGVLSAPAFADTLPSPRHEVVFRFRVDLEARHGSRGFWVVQGRAQSFEPTDPQERESSCFVAWRQNPNGRRGRISAGSPLVSTENKGTFTGVAFEFADSESVDFISCSPRFQMTDSQLAAIFGELADIRLTERIQAIPATAAQSTPKVNARLTKNVQDSALGAAGGVGEPGSVQAAN